MLDSLLSMEEPSASVSNASSRGKRSVRNLTALRRENELLQLLEKCGGIVNTSTHEFVDMYEKLKEAVVNAGETASAPVTAKMDRRTLNYTIDKLESQGKIKMITTTIFSSSGAQRPAKIIYLPSMSEDSVQDFIAARGFATPVQSKTEIGNGKDDRMKRPTPVIQVDESNTPASIARRLLDIPDEEERIDLLLAHSDSVIRETLLLEQQTISQLYGFLPGKAIRARELHMYMLKLFEAGPASAAVISSDCRIVNWSFFEKELPVEVYCMCFRAHSFDSELLQGLRSRESRGSPLKALPRDWHRALQAGRSKSREQIFSLLYFLVGMNVVTPLTESRSGEVNAIHCNSNNGKTRAFQVVTNPKRTRNSALQPQFWMFNKSVPLYLYGARLRPVPYIKHLPVTTQREAELFWNEVKSVSLRENSPDGTAQGDYQSANIAGEADETVANILRRATSWNAEYRLSRLQKQFIGRSIGDKFSIGPLQETEDGPMVLRRLCEVSSAPLSAVQDFIEHRRHQHIRLIEKEKVRKMAAGARAAQLQAARRNLLRDAAGVATGRLQLWNELLNRVSPRRNKSANSTRLRQLQRAFVDGTAVQSTHDWEQQVADALASSDQQSRPNLQKGKQIIPFRIVMEQSTMQHPTTTPERPIQALIDLQRNMVFETGDELKIGQPKSRKKGEAEESKCRSSSLQGVC